MKKIAMIIAVACMAANAHAGLAISWFTGSGLVRNDGTTPLLTSGSALFQLIYSTDNAIGGGILTDAAPTGNDSILEQIVVDSTTADTDASFFSDEYTAALFQSGFVYIRVFDIGTSVGNAAVGTWYFNGPVFATQDINPPNQNQQVTDGPLGGGSGSGGRYVLNSGQVVPEPMSIAFLGIGAAMIAMRRMRKA